jgi:hypothetical protein
MAAYEQENRAGTRVLSPGYRTPRGRHCVVSTGRSRDGPSFRWGEGRTEGLGASDEALAAPDEDEPRDGGGKNQQDGGA